MPHAFPAPSPLSALPHLVASYRWAHLRCRIYCIWVSGRGYNQILWTTQNLDKGHTSHFIFFLTISLRLPLLYGAPEEILIQIPMELIIRASEDEDLASGIQKGCLQQEFNHGPLRFF